MKMTLTTWGMWEGPRKAALEKICEQFQVDPIKANSELLTNIITLVLQASFQLQTLMATDCTSVSPNMKRGAAYKIGLMTLYSSLPVFLNIPENDLNPIVVALIGDCLQIADDLSTYLGQLSQISTQAKTDGITKLYGSDFSTRYSELAKQLPFNDPELLAMAKRAVEAKIPEIVKNEKDRQILNEHCIYMNEVAQQMQTDPGFAARFQQETGMTMEEYKAQVKNPTLQSANSTSFSKSRNPGNQLIGLLDRIGQNGFNVSKEELKQFFADKFSYWVNGEKKADDVESLENRFETARLKTKSGHIHQPLTKSQLRFDAQYDATFTPKEGEDRQVTNNIHAEFDDECKIKSLSQFFKPKAEQQEQLKPQSELVSKP